MVLRCMFAVARNSKLPLDSTLFNVHQDVLGFARKQAKRARLGHDISAVPGLFSNIYRVLQVLLVVQGGQKL